MITDKAGLHNLIDLIRETAKMLGLSLKSYSLNLRLNLLVLVLLWTSLDLPRIGVASASPKLESPQLTSLYYLVSVCYKLESLWCCGIS